MRFLASAFLLTASFLSSICLADERIDIYKTLDLGITPTLEPTEQNGWIYCNQNDFAVSLYTVRSATNQSNGSETIRGVGLICFNHDVGTYTLYPKLNLPAENPAFEKTSTLWAAEGIDTTKKLVGLQALRVYDYIELGYAKLVGFFDDFTNKTTDSISTSSNYFRYSSNKPSMCPQGTAVCGMNILTAKMRPDALYDPAISAMSIACCMLPAN